MFSKLKSLFTQQVAGNPEEQTKFDHSKLSGDAKECPFMKGTMKGQYEKHNKDHKNGADSDSEEDTKQTSGCPMMGGSERKKNPKLAISNSGYDQPFVSKFKYYLSTAKIDLERSSKQSAPRTIFESYPIYLQHTLFYCGDDYSKVRSMQCCSRFMAYEELRERGNKMYTKGHYMEALENYQRAMSLFRWLEYHEQEQEESRVLSTSNSHSSLSDPTDQSQMHIPFEEPSASGEYGRQFKELREKYREFFVVYNDSNVRLHDGEEMDEAPDIDMRKSLLLQIYLNMAATYMQLNHYSLAERVIEDALQLSDRVSQCYLRLAQCFICRLDSPLPQLYHAQKLLNKAIEMKPHEKIYSNANRNILRMLNLHDVDQVYAECLTKAQFRIAEKAKRLNLLYETVYQRTKEIHHIEQSIIASGRVPKEDLEEETMFETTELRILLSIKKKYLKVIEFYLENKNQEQVALAKKELQHILGILAEIGELQSIQLQQQDGELGGLQSQKVIHRVEVIKTRQTEQIYNRGHFNFTMLEWVIKEIVKEDQAKQAATKKDIPEEVEAPEKRKWTRLTYLLVILPLLLIAIGMFLH